MKALLLTMLVWCFGLATGLLFAQGPANTVATATNFVDLLSKRDYAGAVARFDPTMKQALPATKLQELWERLQQQLGPFQKQSKTHTLRYGPFDIVLVTCQFERGAVDAKVVLDSQERVSGLFFLPPSQAATAWTPPSYAHTNDFREQPFTVGQGEWRLPGTLTLPRQHAGATPPWPVVVLVHGSGPNDRDETVGANMPFRDLAWGLASRGIAVLRYEKRTKQYAERLKGQSLAGFTLKQETIDDALSAVEQLRHTPDIDPKGIFVLGHSLGAIAAPRLGEADPHLAGLILLAGASLPLEDLIIEQTRYLLSLDGTASEAAQAKLKVMTAQVARIKRLTQADTNSPTPILGAPPAYWLDLRAHDPVTEAAKLKQPLLILQGGRDYQVTPANFARWQPGLSSRTNVTFKLYPDLNHLFITGHGPSTPAEYDEPGHVAETVITQIADWITARRADF